MEIVVDAHDEGERAMGWYRYLGDQLQFPFTATCIAKRAISPLRIKDEVEVIGMPDEDECAGEVFVTIRWEKDGLAAPLSQLKPISHTDEQTRQAIEDWPTGSGWAASSEKRDTKGSRFVAEPADGRELEVRAVLFVDAVDEGAE